MSDNFVPIRDLKILLVGHITESYGPMQALPEYLVKYAVDEFAVIAHPLPYTEIQASRCQVFRGGKVVRQLKGPDYKTFEPLHYVGDVLLTFCFLLKLGGGWDLYIGSDCLNTFTGVILRFLGVVKKVVFYEIDYTPQRLRPEILNRVFHWFDKFAARGADVIWDNPPNLTEIRRRQGADLGRIVRVPNGIDLDQVTIPESKDVQRNTLAYAGHVVKSRGMQLAVPAIAEVAKQIPDVKVAIVGGGPYEQTLKELVKQYGVEKHFEFFGYTKHEWTLSYLPSCGAALAPYLPEERGTFQYADSLKVIEYLGCGVPTIVTRVPPRADEIEKEQLGIAINYDQRELEEAILKLLTDDQFWETCRRNAIAYSARLMWDKTFNGAFRQTLALARLSPAHSRAAQPARPEGEDSV